MKMIDYSRISIVALVLILTAGYLSSCNEDEGLSKKITVIQVFLHTVDSTTSVITEAQLGTLVRIDGSGFSTLRAVYCNGVKASVNPNYVTEHSILFSIPGGAPAGSKAAESVRNTIRLVTDYDDYTFPFTILSTPPGAASDAYSVGVNKELTVSVEEGVLSNDTDVEGDELTASLESTTSNGTLTFNDDGSFTYVPNNNFSGTDTFTYYANDGQVDSSTPGTVTISVFSAPVITAVSHTLAKVGETIVIYGTGFADISSVTFPGDITLTEGEFTVNGNLTAITCVVPAGVTKGAIKVEGTGGIAYSYDYMFRNECLIINWNFGQGYSGSFGDLTPLSGTKTTAFPTGGDPSSPAGGYRHCPNTDPPSTTTLPVSNGVASGFNFNPATAAQALINNTGGLITASTDCKDLALQMDFYISAPWGSGYFKVNFKPGTESYSGIIPPQWATIGNGQGITMTGWLTATLPLQDVPDLESATVQDVIDNLNANGTFTFVNNDLSLNGTTYTAKEIPNFQIFLGSYRIVPYVKPQ